VILNLFGRIFKEISSDTVLGYESSTNEEDQGLMTCNLNFSLSLHHSSPFPRSTNICPPLPRLVGDDDHCHYFRCVVNGKEGKTIATIWKRRFVLTEETRRISSLTNEHGVEVNKWCATWPGDTAPTIVSAGNLRSLVPVVARPSWVFSWASL